VKRLSTPRERQKLMADTLKKAALLGASAYLGAWAARLVVPRAH